MPGEMKLTYFHLRGRAELSRLLFKLAGKEFNDNRVTGESWQQFKPSKDRFFFTLSKGFAYYDSLQLRTVQFSMFLSDTRVF